MPELPEVEALARHLSARTAGKRVEGLELHSIAALKTHAPPPSALQGLVAAAWSRRGKFLDMDAGPLHLVIHLARAGWVRWSDAQAARSPSMRGPLACRLRFDDGSGLDITERGTEKRLAVYVVRDPQEVPGISRLGVDVMADEMTVERLGALLRATSGQIKGVLSDQSVIAGIGNAYSDEILHAARLSPFRQAPSLTTEEALRLHQAARTVLQSAVDRAVAVDPTKLKEEKRASMAVHGRTGEACPACGDVVRQVSFATRSLQYCARCQTRGQVLADRRLSRLLR